MVGIGPGNGQAFARRFAAEGCAVALLSRSTALSGKIAADLGDTKAFACDVIDPSSIRSAFASVRETMGRVECLL